ncbi:hypothetical protein [Actinopolymorpha pittospori]
MSKRPKQEFAAASKLQQTSPVDRLAAEAEHATRLRQLQVHPDVVALRVERVRRRVDRCMWLGILLGLGFTAANVQAFAAGDAPVGSLAWTVAWLLDPMVSVVLLGVLWAEQETGRYRIASGRVVRMVKWFAFGATYVMNTWQSWAAASPSGIVLHSVPPLLVLAAAEVGPELRHRLTAAVDRSYRQAAASLAVTNRDTTATAPDAATAIKPDDTGTGPAELATASIAVDATRSAIDTPVRGAHWEATPVPLVALQGGRNTSSGTAQATYPEGGATKAKSGGRGGDKQSMRSHWDAETAAGRVPSGADLNRAAGKDAGASLGRKYASEWRAELDADDNAGAENADNAATASDTDADVATGGDTATAADTARGSGRTATREAAGAAL